MSIKLTPTFVETNFPSSVSSGNLLLKAAYSSDPLNNVATLEFHDGEEIVLNLNPGSYIFTLSRLDANGNILGSVSASYEILANVIEIPSEIDFALIK